MFRALYKKLGYFFFWGIVLLTTGYFAYHGLGIGGGRGYMALAELDHDIIRSQAELDELQEHRQWLEHRVSLVAEGEVDADLLGELARKNGGLYAPGELIIPLK